MRVGERRRTRKWLLKEGCQLPPTHVGRQSHWRPSFHCGKVWSTCTERASMRVASCSPPRTSASLAPLPRYRYENYFLMNLFVKKVFQKGQNKKKLHSYLLLLLLGNFDHFLVYKYLTLQ
jgi:hypothetical protein